MARPKLRRPDQPLALQLLLGLYEAAASLKLAVVTIGAGAIVLAWATFVEKAFGTEAVSFGIYQSWWFAVLLGLLGLNVLCAALIRYPWKKYQIGFLVTHAGILTLLAGCLVQRVWGTSGNLVVYEGDAEHVAFEDQKHFRLTVSSTDPRDRDVKPEEIKVPFRSGPFNWDDYEHLFFFPWRLAARDHGLIYRKDGIELEVLDYLADSRRVLLPRLALDVAPLGIPAHAGMGLDEPSRIELSVKSAAGPHGRARPNGFADRQQTSLGPSVVFWLAGSEGEAKAFVECVPKGPLGPLGQVVLSHGGETFRFSAVDLQKQPEQPLGKTGLSIRFEHFDPRTRGVQIEVRRGEDPPETMSLVASQPYFNTYAEKLGVYGAYWAEPPAIPPSLAGREDAIALRTADAMRLEVLLGRDGRLYYREWNAPQVAAAGPWPADGDDAEDAIGTKVVAFRDTPQALSLQVAEFQPESRPKVEVVPRPFKREEEGRTKEARAKVRLTVDGNSGEFWLPLGGPRFHDEQAVVSGRDRRVELILGQNLLELGFQVYLHDFKRKVDPGTPADSHYSSLVDVLDLGDKPKVVTHGALITMNQPLSTKDPNSGRTYRFYQASFKRVGKPGEPEFDERVYGASRFFKPDPREDLYYSVLSLNYDPGRGLKYAGSLLIVAGTVIIFYMKTFLTRRREAGGPGERGEPRASARGWISR